MQARDVMTLQVCVVEADASIMEAVRLMLQNRISGLPVVGFKGELVGIVTEGDFLRRGEIGTRRRRSRWLEFLEGGARSPGLGRAGLGIRSVLAGGRGSREGPARVGWDAPIR
jgi:hypothetical protein